MILTVMCRGLQCDFVLPLIGYCDASPNYCMVMPLMEHGNLYDLLQSENPIADAWSFKVKVALEIAKGMQYLHSLPKKIIHRDLKSLNVLVCVCNIVVMVRVMAMFMEWL